MKKFHVSLAQWSLHRAFQNNVLSHLDFPVFTRKNFDLDGIEYVNCFFKEDSNSYVNELKKRCDDYGIKSLLIMCDDLGRLGDPDKRNRLETVDKHYKWLEIAKKLGCHSIRVNAESEGDYDEQMNLAFDGLSLLSEKAESFDLNVIVENHGGLSSNGLWLSELMAKISKNNCGTLPDFGNFCEYDKYKGVAELMPWAKSVSAKTFDFDEAGQETTIDYKRMIKTVTDAGFNAWLGVEYEGYKYSEVSGIQMTIDLLKTFQ